jgi:restriction system protein
MSDSPLWALHHAGGRELIEEGVVAIGWVAAGDLGGLPDDRDAFKEHLRILYSAKSEPWIANAAGQLLRFRHGMGVGDLIVYPQKSDRSINIGRIQGDYAYVPATSARHPHQRRVEWLKTGLPRDPFSQGCLYELGSAMSVFTVKTHRDEILAALSSAPDAAAPVEEIEDAEVPEEDEPTVKRITELTHDYILKTFNTELKGHPFAQFCGWLLEAIGYVAQVSPPGNDRGIDIEATEDPLGVKRPLLKLQCKSGTGATGAPDVQALNGTLAEQELGLFVSVGGFTAAARQAAAGMPRMRLLGAEDLVDLVLAHYPSLPDEAKEALRLRRVWMPDRATPPDVAEGVAEA